VFLLASELEGEVVGHGLEGTGHSTIDHCVVHLPEAAEQISTSLCSLLLEVHGDHVSSVKVAMKSLLVRQLTWWSNERRRRFYHCNVHRRGRDDAFQGLIFGRIVDVPCR
jgi:hypothetical protein